MTRPPMPDPISSRMPHVCAADVLSGACRPALAPAGIGPSVLPAWLPSAPCDCGFACELDSPLIPSDGLPFVDVALVGLLVDVPPTPPLEVDELELLLELLELLELLLELLELLEDELELDELLDELGGGVDVEVVTVGTTQPLFQMAWPTASQLSEYVFPLYVKGGMMSPQWCGVPGDQIGPLSCLRCPSYAPATSTVTCTYGFFCDEVAWQSVTLPGAAVAAPDANKTMIEPVAAVVAAAMSPRPRHRLADGSSRVPPV